LALFASLFFSSLSLFPPILPQSYFGLNVLGLLIYVWHRHHRKLPIGRTIQRDWEKEQLAVYEDAGEYDLADEFRENIERKRRLHGELERESRLPLGTKVLDVPLEEINGRSRHQSHRKGSKV